MTDLVLAPDLALPLEIVTEATAIVATRGAGKSSTSAVVVEEAFGVEVQCVVIDRTGVYWGLQSNAKGDGPGLPIYVLGGPHADAPLEHTAGVLVADLIVDTGHSFVLDLSDFSKSAAVKFAADLLERLYDRKARARTTTLLVIDEAHFYAPQTPRGGFKGDAARLMGAMEDVVGLGRSRGLGVVLTTQRTQALNKAILDLIETLIVMRMLSPRAKAAVRDWIQEKHEDDELGVIASLDSLPTGEAWIWSPLRQILQRSPIRRIRTFNSYLTPRPGEAVIEPSRRAELDLAALGEQIAATIERAKEDDPNELRKRIRELEAGAGDAHDLQVVVDAVRQAALSGGENACEQLVNVYAGVSHALDLGYSATVVDEVRALAARPAVAALSEEELGALKMMRDEIMEAHGRIAAGLAAFVEAVNDLAVRTSADSRAPALQTPVPARRPDPVAVPDAVLPARRPAAAAPRPESNGHITGSEQKILDALAWYEELNIAQPTLTQVGLVSGYKQGGRFNNLLIELRGKQLVHKPVQGALALTDAGRALAQGPSLPRTARALQDAVLSTLPPSEARVLSALIGHRDGVPREHLASETGYAVGGRFNNIVSKLKSLGLAEYGPGWVRPATILWP